MPRISRSRLQRKKLYEISENFVFLISSLTKRADVGEFFRVFLTEEEKVMVAKRLALFMMIQKQYPAWVIQATLSISYETVRTYTYRFSASSSVFRSLIVRLIRKEEAEAFWKKIDTILRPLDLALRAKHDMRARAKLMSGDWS